LDVFADEAGKLSSNSDCHQNVVGCEAPEVLGEVIAAGEESKATAHITKPLRKRSARRRGGNGLCPPQPPEDVPVVDWSEPTEIKHIFPKTYNYVVYAQARYSSQYLNLSKWKKEFDFFLDKYKYWRDIIKKKQLTEYKEITKAKQLVGQLKWLLDHCWEGDESKPLVPEMIWRARKEEARRCEQLLIRKEYLKRKAMVKTAVPSFSRRVNANINLRKYVDVHSDSVKNDIGKLSSTFQKKDIQQAESDDNFAGLSKSSLSNKLCGEEEEQEDGSPNFWKDHDQIIKKRAHLFSLQFLVRRWADVLKQLQMPPGVVRPLCYRTFLQNRVEQYVRDLVTMYEKIKDSNDFNEQTIHILLRRDVLLKEDMCENGLGSLTNNWVIFESKSPKVFKKKVDREMGSRESSKSPEKLLSSSTSSTLLKVRDYLDDDVKSATPNSRAGQMMCDPSGVTNTMQLAATEDNGESVPDLTTDADIPRPVAIRPHYLTEDEKNRLELQEVVAVETLWAKFSKAEASKCKNFFCFPFLLYAKFLCKESKRYLKSDRSLLLVKDDTPILDAIEAVLRSCKSYRAAFEIPLPKTLADIRRAAKFRQVHISVALLQALIIERHETKTGRRLDLTIFETPEIRRLRAQFAASVAARTSNPIVSVGPAEVPPQISRSTGIKSLESSSPGVKSPENDIKQELDEIPPKKKQKQLNEKITESGKDGLEREARPMKNDGKIEMLAPNRPKRHIKAPQRFIFDDEEKEEKKKKMVMRERTKTAEGNSLKAIKKLKETSQYSSVHKEKHEKNSSLSSVESSSMETIVVIPEDDSIDAYDLNCWSSNTNDEVLLDIDLVDVTAEHEFKHEPDGIVRDTFRYIGTWKDGTAKEVSKRIYELWTNRKKFCSTTAVRFVCYRIKIVKEAESTTKQQRSIVAQTETSQQKQIPSINLLTYPDDTSISNERVINHSSAADVYPNDSINRLSNTGPCSSQDIAFGSTSREQNEDGDCGPWRQVAFRKEASLSGPIKLDKLKTQYDHLLMISEKNYLGKLYSEWMYIPEGGLFDDRIKCIRQFIQELEDILNQPNSTWRDYFNMKRYLQTLIDNVMTEFNALSGQVASTNFPHTSDAVFSSSRSTVSDAERNTPDISTRPNSN
uniref:Helicase domino n=1 Tax=Elaeophora elaphi TaxID=1147741 RepID=A0A0R3RTX7_9BILA